MLRNITQALKRSGLKTNLSILNYEVLPNFLLTSTVCSYGACDNVHLFVSSFVVTKPVIAYACGTSLHKLLLNGMHIHAVMINYDAVINE